MKYIVLITIALSHLYGVTAEYQETYVVEPGTIVEVHNINGGITISRTADSKVEVNVEKKTKKGADELEKVTFEVSVGKKLVVETKYLEEEANVTVTYDIKVPSHVVVGSVSTANGSIKLEKTVGNVVLHSSNGDLVVKSNTGSVTAQTSNGDIITEDTDVIIEATTSNGKIKAELSTIPEEGVKVISRNGSITLYIADDVDAEVNAATSNGRVSVEGLDLTNSTLSKKSVVGVLGEGGPQIRITTSNGMINLYRLEE